MSWESGPDPGVRDRPVRVEQRTETRDATTKAPTSTWSTLATPVWMSRDDRAGRERFAAQQVTAAFDTRWAMGYRPDMDPELVDVAKDRRIVYAGRTYGVVFGRQIGRQAGIELFTLAAGKVS